NLQNEQEKIWLDKQAADTTWKTTINGDVSMFPTSSVRMKTLRFTETDIHDFAWFADKRFHVIKGIVKLPESGREVSTWLMFTNQQANLWKDAMPYVNDGIRNFSVWLGDYPYNSFTAVQSALNAGSGMEYPGITVIGLASDAFALEEVITHEIGHNWFYSALASDERRFPFMDEGTTSAYECKYLNEKYPERKLWEYIFREKKQARFFHIEDMPASRIEEIEWLSLVRENEEQAINLAAHDYTFQNYNAILYSKAALGFNYLRAYLGDSIFDASMHDYYRIWRFRHPQPDDLRDIFKSHTDKDLSWFFCDFVGTIKRLDYQIIRFENQKLLIKNKGELTSPLLIAGMTVDSVCFEQWVEGFAGQQWIDVPIGNYSELRIDPRHITPEINRLNNNIRVNGNFKKIDKIQTQLTFSIENPDKRTLMYIPAINWTREDGFMPGIALHNGFLVPKPIEYFIMPFFSFKNTDLAGYGKISYNITPYDAFIRKAAFILEGTQYGAPENQNYHSIRVGAELFLRARKMNRPLRQKVFGY
ncbi:MAG: M1 family aminopeptidase, partial [Bacteroidales bacterium]